MIYLASASSSGTKYADRCALQPVRPNRTKTGSETVAHTHARVQVTPRSVTIGAHRKGGVVGQTAQTIRIGEVRKHSNRQADLGLQHPNSQLISTPRDNMQPYWGKFLDRVQLKASEVSNIRMAGDVIKADDICTIGN